MWKAVTRATNRTLAYVALGSVVVIVGLQVVIFAIWGNDGDPPDAVVAAAFVVFWGAILTLIVVAVVAVRRRRAAQAPGRGST